MVVVVRSFERWTSEKFGGEKHESCTARRKRTSRDDSGAVVSRPWR